MKPKTTIVNIGAGWVTNRRHIPALQASGNFKTLGILSRNLQNAQKTAKRFNLPHYSDQISFDTGWASEAEAVMIGCAPQAHYELARSALLAGKHVLLDKPMTIHPGHARELVELAQSQARVIAMVHNVEFCRAAKALKARLQRGDLGQIRSIYAIQSSNPKRPLPGWVEELPLGHFFVEAPHFYYLICWLAQGRPQLESSTIIKKSHTSPTPRSVSAIYRSPHDGIPIQLHMDFNSSLTEWHLAVVTDAGILDIDSWRDTLLFIPNDGAGGAWSMVKKTTYTVGQHTWGALRGAMNLALGRQHFGNLDIVRHFHLAIQGEPLPTGMRPERGLDVVEMQHEAIDKAQTI